jgi:hypothetical protein
MPYGDAKSGFMVVQCQIALYFLKIDGENSQPYLTDKEEDNKNLFKDFDYFVSPDAPTDDFVGWNDAYDAYKIAYRVWMLPSFSIRHSGDYGMLIKEILRKIDTYSRDGVCKISRDRKEHDGLLFNFNLLENRAITIE